jgi:hypothetical protein
MTQSSAMRHTRWLSSVALGAFVLGVQSPAKSAPSLCDAQTEQTIFSCQFRNGKVASICGPRNLSQEFVTLQYRFGSRDRPPELVFPQDPHEGNKAFGYTVYGAAKWESRNAGFEIGAYSYLVSSYSGVHDVPEASILVRREGASCTVLSCRGEFTDNLHVLDQLSLVEIPRDALARKCRPNDGQR